MYSGVMLSSALYIKVALVNLSLSTTDRQPSPLNICADGVAKSACSIIRAARFCSFGRRSKFALENAPQIIYIIFSLV